MLTFRPSCFISFTLLISCILIFSVMPATAGLNDLFGKKEIDETERTETIERIQSIQEKLKLLQDKLRVLERRKAAKNAAQRASELGGPATAPAQANWFPVDETDIEPEAAGIYTYLLFKGDISNTSALGALEDFILTIETLPVNEIPAGLANRFLLPAEKPQSTISLGRRPYDFKLNEAYLGRLNLHDNLPDGPVLVSMKVPVDPYGVGDVPAFMAVSFGRQSPQRALDLAKIWHKQESSMISSNVSPVSELFWELIDGAGPIQVARDKNRIQVVLPQK
jgi:hypothetical protein